MSLAEIEILGHDVTSRVIGKKESALVLKEYNDESFYFSGILRRANIEITFDNNSDFFKSRGPLFPADRNNTELKIFYKSNNSLIDRKSVFSGVIDEASTDTDITNRSIKFTILDNLKFLSEKILELGDQTAIDNLYIQRTGSSDIRLNKHYLASFLFFFLRKNNFELNKIFNVFSRNSLLPGTYPSINSTIESIFPPSDEYYSIESQNALDVLNELCKGINSYLILENFNSGSLLSIKARPLITQTKKLISKTDILNLYDYLDGFNKLYNKIVINNDSNPLYEDKASIQRYGVKEINIKSYTPASQSLANSYLNYYSTPKKELNIDLKMNHTTLDMRIGDCVSINQSASSDFRRQGFSGNFFIIARTLMFKNDVVNLRLREL